MSHQSIPQSTENTTKNLGEKVANDQHLMPGLINPVCAAFDHPKRHLTTRGVARQMRMAETFAVSALLRDTRRELNELRSMVARALGSDPKAATVREFRVFNGGRVA